MKAIKYLLWMLFSLCVMACSENPESYRDKILDGFAKKQNTTKELLVEDLGIQIDSMNLTTFRVEDSITFLAQRHELIVTERPEELKKVEEAVRFWKAFYGRNPSIKKIRDMEEYCETIKQEIKNDSLYYDSTMKSLSKRNPKEVLFKVVTFRAAVRYPFIKVHQLHRTAEFFTPDGKTYCADISESMKNYVVDRERKKQEKK